MKISQREIDERQQEILQYIRETRFCKNEDLADRFGISISTVRRYIQQMEEKGSIVRYRGGIMLPQSPDDKDSLFEAHVYSNRNSEEKSAIMRYVANHLIDAGDTILINGSSTALCLYRHLTQQVTIASNNPMALFTDRIKSQNFVLIGGEPSLQRGDNILCGEFALNMISQINANVCILGVSGISLENGLTSSSPQDVSVNRAMLGKTNGKRIIVADHSKIGIAYNFKFCDVTDTTHLVTDDKADHDELIRLSTAGIDITVVDADGYGRKVS